MLNRHSVQTFQSLVLGETFAYEMRIHALEIGKTHQLGRVGIIPDIARRIRMFLPPLPGGLAKQGDVQQICFAGIDIISAVG